jgi:hypothetical protein
MPDMPNRERLLELALKGLQADRAKLDDEIAAIKREISPPTVVPKSRRSGAPTPAPVKGKRTMSLAARKKISEGMKRRYTAMRRSAVQPRLQGEVSQGGGLTAAGRKKLSQMMKARWAAKKKAAKK